MFDFVPQWVASPTDRRLAFTAMALGVMAWVVPLFVSSDTTLRLTREDGPYETVGAIGFAVAGVLFGTLFVRTWKSHRCWWFLALAGLFLFAAGEEVSWGQRLFGWGDVDRATNVQGETTLHNLEVFDTVEGGWLKFPRLFLFFWLGWLILLPALTHVVAPLRRLVDTLRVPVPALVFGLVMLANLALSKTYRLLGLDEVALERIAEIRECAQALALVAVALSFLLRPPGRLSPSAHLDQIAGGGRGTELTGGDVIEEHPHALDRLVGPRTVEHLEGVLGTGDLGVGDGRP